MQSVYIKLIESCFSNTYVVVQANLGFAGMLGAGYCIEKSSLEFKFRARAWGIFLFTLLNHFTRLFCFLFAFQMIQQQCEKIIESKIQIVCDGKKGKKVYHNKRKNTLGLGLGVYSCLHY